MTHLKNCGGGGMQVALHAAIVGYVPLGDGWQGAVPGGGSTTHVNIGGGGGGGGGGGFGGGGGGRWRVRDRVPLDGAACLIALQ